MKTRQVIAFRFSWAKNIMRAEASLREALTACMNKPLILMDKGPWYITFSMRNRIGMIRHPQGQNKTLLIV